MSAGSISYDEFRGLVENFVHRSNKINDKWRMERGTNGFVYMCKRAQVATVNGEEKLTDVSAEQPSKLPELAALQQHDSDRSKLETGDSLSLSDMEIEAEVDESCMPSGETLQKHILTYEYHVVYSESYAVPVLYFNVCKPDGHKCSLDEIWKMCPTAYQSYLSENKWTTLTQQEHPILGQPYMQLHPCHTSDLMAQVTAAMDADRRRKNYLVTWLSAVGPMIRLLVSPDYIT